MWKKTLALLLVAFVAANSIWPATVSASSDSVAEPRVSLEEAIITARAAVPELEWLEEADFRAEYLDGSWRLMWSTDDRKQVSISVNADNGRLLEYNLWDYNWGQKYPPLPLLTEEEALAQAENFLQKVAPAELAACRLQDSVPPRPYLRERSSAVSYSFTWQRFANDIPFNFNGLRVTVNGDTGLVTGYSCIWTEGHVPQPSNIISEDKAAKVAQEAGKMELQYFWPYAEYGKTEKPILIYSAPKLNSIYVNAHTGEIYKPWLDPRYAGEAEKLAPDATLSPAELAEVELIAGLLTQEEAEATARQTFAIAESYNLQDANLVLHRQFDEQRHWTLSFVEDREEGIRNRIYVTLDAETGEIYRYSASVPRDSDKGTISRSEAEAIARAYIEKMNPAKAQEVELVQPELGTEPERPEEYPTSYYFNYRRLVNGVPFPQNGFSVSIYAGQEPLVTSYNLTWVEAEFPPVAGSLTLNQAHAALRNKYPFHLEYRVAERGVRPLPLPTPAMSTAATAVDANASSPITLVYTQAPVPSHMFSAQDMQPLNYRGEPVKQEETVAPKDVAGHPAEADILFLAKVGILPVPEDGLYRPNDKASLADWLEILVRAAGVSENERKTFLYLDDDLDETRDLQRQELAVYAIRALGYERVAAMSNIFRLAAADAEAVNADYIGHVAIALELKLLTLDGDTIAPQAAVTKGELPGALMQMFRSMR